MKDHRFQRNDVVEFEVYIDRNREESSQVRAKNMPPDGFKFSGFIAGLIYVDLYCMFFLLFFEGQSMFIVFVALQSQGVDTSCWEGGTKIDEGEKTHPQQAAEETKMDW